MDENDEVHFAHKVKKLQFMGMGGFILVFSFIVPIILRWLLGVLGIIIGLVLFFLLFIYGYKKSTRWICSNCGNNLPDRSVKVCPYCKSKFIN